MSFCMNDGMTGVLTGVGARKHGALEVIHFAGLRGLNVIVEMVDLMLNGWEEVGL